MIENNGMTKMKILSILLIAFVLMGADYRIQNTAGDTVTYTDISVPDGSAVQETALLAVAMVEAGFDGVGEVIKPYSKRRTFAKVDPTDKIILRNMSEGVRVADKEYATVELAQTALDVIKDAGGCGDIISLEQNQSRATGIIDEVPCFHSDF